MAEFSAVPAYNPNFEGGHLVARNQAGAVLWAWLADEAMGRPLADLLNHSQSLSRLLLPPWPGRQDTQASESCRITVMTA